MYKSAKKYIAIVLAFTLAFTMSTTVSFGASKKVKKVKITTPSVKTYKIPKGSKVKFKVTVSPKKASKSVTWKSSNKKIATVNKKGVVKAKKKGTVKITAISKNNKKVKAVKKVKVVSPVKSIKIKSPTAKDFQLNVGDKKTFKVAASPKGTSSEVKWTTSNKKVATVNKSGKVTAKAKGTVKITATSKFNKKAKVSKTITINPATVNIKSVTLGGKAVVGSELTAKVSPSNANCTYVWSHVENGKSTAIKGATSSTYTPVVADEDKYISVKVIGTGYTKGTVESKAQKVLSKTEAIKSNIDADNVVKIIERITKESSNPDLGFRMSGSQAEKNVAKYIQDEYKKMGLKNVTMDPIKADGWEFKKGDLTFKNENNETEKALVSSYQTTFQTNGAKEYNLVYAGMGRKQDYEKLADNNITIDDKTIVMIDTDQWNWFWITSPAYEAKIQGAAAVLACENSDEDESYAMYSNDQLQSQDVCGPADAPALSISRNTKDDLLKLIKANDGEYTITLDVDAKVTPNAGSQNVWAEIPGKGDGTIIVMAHYDSYFKAALDDADGTAINMTVAKAMMDSGYTPEKTIRFVHHGAEEWGLADSNYDWAIGAYRQIAEVHPEWANDTFAAINVDSFTIQNRGTAKDKALAINAPQLTDFARNVINKNLPEGYKIAEDRYGDVANNYFEDFAYMTSGIPKILFSRTDFQSRFDTYHSSADNLDYYKNVSNQDKIAGDKVMIIASTIMSFDDQLVQPVNYESYFEGLKESIDTDIGGVPAGSVDSEVDTLVSLAKNLDDAIVNINEEYVQAVREGDTETVNTLKADAGEIKTEMSNLYKLFQKSFTRLDYDGEVVAPHEMYQSNIEVLEAALDLIDKGDAESAANKLRGIDNNGKIKYFSKETCEQAISQVDPAQLATNEDRLAWGTGMLEKPHQNLYEEMADMYDKANEETPDLSAEKTAVEAALDDQRSYLADVLGTEATDCQSVITQINKVLQLL